MKKILMLITGFSVWVSAQQNPSGIYGMIQSGDSLQLLTDSGWVKMDIKSGFERYFNEIDPDGNGDIDYQMILNSASKVQFGIFIFNELNWSLRSFTIYPLFLISEDYADRKIKELKEHR